MPAQQQSQLCRVAWIESILCLDSAVALPSQVQQVMFVRSEAESI
jgi:hypothetical protein